MPTQYLISMSAEHPDKIVVWILIQNVTIHKTQITITKLDKQINKIYLLTGSH